MSRSQAMTDSDIIDLELFEEAIPDSESSHSKAHSKKIDTTHQRRGPLMFWLSIADLIAFAGLIHRADQIYVTGLELYLILGVLFGLWPIFIFEAWMGVRHRHHLYKFWPAFLRAVLVTFIPPYRLGMIDPRNGMIWLPRLGWQRPGKELLLRLNRIFGVPLLLFALLLLPVLGVEFFAKKYVQESPILSAIMNVSLAIIWLAFALDFLLKVEASGRPLIYVKEKWLDLAIVLLPTTEFLLNTWADAGPIARLVRSVRVIGPDQLARMGRMYRLRGVLMKGWHALLALELIARLVGVDHRKQLERVESEIALMEQELALLQQQADELRQKIAKQEELARKYPEDVKQAQT